MTEETKYKVPALEKAIAIIETLSERTEPIGVSDLCKQLDIPKTSAFFILNTLEQHAYINKTADGKYRLGSKFIHVGLTALHRVDLRTEARPYMEKLQEETGFTVHLAVLDGFEPMYVEKVENRAFVKFSTYIGQRLPLHASGVGKALAAFMPPEMLAQALQQHGLPEKTEKTITSVPAFMAEMEAIRKQGYSVEDEEGESGIRCIGAPIFDHTGALKAALSITALRTELPIHEIPGLGVQVIRTANDISRHIGYGS